MEAEHSGATKAATSSMARMEEDKDEGEEQEQEQAENAIETSDKSSKKKDKYKKESTVHQSLESFEGNTIEKNNDRDLHQSPKHSEKDAADTVVVKSAKKQKKDDRNLRESPKCFKNDVIESVVTFTNKQKEKEKSIYQSTRLLEKGVERPHDESPTKGTDDMKTYKATYNTTSTLPMVVADSLIPSSSANVFDTHGMLSLLDMIPTLRSFCKLHNQATTCGLNSESLTFKAV